MVILVSPNYPLITMSKSSNFFGQPIYGQLIKSLNRDKIVEISRKQIQRFDSLREIETSMTAEVPRLRHSKNNENI